MKIVPVGTVGKLAMPVVSSFNRCAALMPSTPPAHV
jgi:hypothetical protein